MLKVKKATFYEFGGERPTARVLVEHETEKFSARSKGKVATLPFVLILEVPASEARAMQNGDAEAFQMNIENVDGEAYELHRKAYLAGLIGETSLFGPDMSQDLPHRAIHPRRQTYKLEPVDDGKVYTSLHQLRLNQTEGFIVEPVRRLTDPQLYN
jgi:hypothetical protein